MSTCSGPRRTVTTRRRPTPPVFQEDLAASARSRSAMVAAIYGLVGWFHLVLCPIYAAAGLLPRGPLDHLGGPATWTVAYGVTGLLMVLVATAIVAGSDLAWRIAPWCVLPNLVAHVVFLAVLPVWGVVAITSDVVAAGVVVGERRRRRVATPERSSGPSDQEQRPPASAPRSMFRKQRTT